MPYVDEEARAAHILGVPPRDPGELNYAITKLMDSYVQRKGMRYAVMNDVLGAVEGAKQEFYRRVVAPYEDKKRAENGDVYRSAS